MNYSVRSREFIAGTIAGVILFLSFNVATYLVSQCDGCTGTLGFPFPIYRYSSVRTPGASEYHHELLVLDNIVWNLIVIGLSSLGIGVLTEIGLNWLGRRSR
jgi:hypothetical protein